MDEALQYTMGMNTHYFEGKRGKQAQQTGLSVNEGDGVWVQCDKCQKWRLLPSFVDSTSLPDKWFCSMNVYDNFNSCLIPEQSTANHIDKPPTNDEVRKKKRVADENNVKDDNTSNVLNDNDPTTTLPSSGKKPGRRARVSEGGSDKKTTSRQQSAEAEKEKKSKQQDEQEWVQCESCQKWLVNTACFI